MIDSTIERQAIRAALALAVASAHGQVADAIADMRDEAAQLIALCINGNVASDSMRIWCEGASALVERLSSDGYLPRRPALSASAAILRLRLTVAQKPVDSVGTVNGRPARTVKKRITPPVARPEVRVEGKQKIIVELVAGHPDIRTKDIVDSLRGSLSPRSIKRCLKELCAAGVLKRTKSEDRSVMYRVDTKA